MLSIDERPDGAHHDVGHAVAAHGHDGGPDGEPFPGGNLAAGANPHLRAQGVSGECAAVFHHAVDGAYADGLHKGIFEKIPSMVM